MGGVAADFCRIRTYSRLSWSAKPYIEFTCRWEWKEADTWLASESIHVPSFTQVADLNVLYIVYTIPVPLISFRSLKLWRQKITLGIYADEIMSRPLAPVYVNSRKSGVRIFHNPQGKNANGYIHFSQLILHRCMFTEYKHTSSLSLSLLCVNECCVYLFLMGPFVGRSSCA